MIRITTSLSAKEIVTALQAQPREVLLDVTKELLTTHPDAPLLEEVADMVLAELERRATNAKPPAP